MKRRYFLLSCGAAVLSGCASWNLPLLHSSAPEELKPVEAGPKLVRDLALADGMFPIKVEYVGLVTGLPGTGSDPGPSVYREILMEDMKKRGVKNPNALLASGTTSLVTVRGVLRPGIQKGDRFDVEIRVPEGSETKSLRGGHLLETRLKQMAVFKDGLHDGADWGVAQGPVLVDLVSDTKKDRVASGRGRVLGGAVALHSRLLRLVLKEKHQNVRDSALVAAAINKRFHTFQKWGKTAVAKAKTDEFIELAVQPRYKHNIERYLDVVRAIAIRESAPELTDRIAALEKRLCDPGTTAEAAMELEAIGVQGVDTLLKGIRSGDRLVRFHAAESLAYLDRREAAEPLAEAARNEPAVRVFALTALAGMDDPAAYEQLRELLTVSSAETRYGAFRALWMMNPNDGLVKGERLGAHGGEFSYHVLGTHESPMVHATSSRRAEIVLFGPEQRFLTPLAINMGKIVITASGDEVTVSKFAVNEADQKRTVSTSVDEVIRAIVDLGGSYPDVVQALQEAKASGSLSSRFEIDALPEAGRVYGLGDEEKAGESAKKATPKQSEKTGKNADSKAADRAASDPADSDKKTQPKRGFLARIMGRD